MTIKNIEVTAPNDDNWQWSSQDQGGSSDVVLKSPMKDTILS